MIVWKLHYILFIVWIWTYEYLILYSLNMEFVSKWSFCFFTVAIHNPDIIRILNQIVRNLSIIVGCFIYFQVSCWFSFPFPILWWLPYRKIVLNVAILFIKIVLKLYVDKPWSNLLPKFFLIETHWLRNLFHNNSIIVIPRTKFISWTANSHLYLIFILRMKYHEFNCKRFPLVKQFELLLLSQFF
jgi:hypothetical protein